MAAQLKQDLGSDVELVVGNPGELTVWLGDQKIAEKVGGMFPNAEDVVAAVRDASR